MKEEQRKKEKKERERIRLQKKRKEKEYLLVCEDIAWGLCRALEGTCPSKDPKA